MWVLDDDKGNLNVETERKLAAQLNIQLRKSLILTDRLITNIASIYCVFLNVLITYYFSCPPPAGESVKGRTSGGGASAIFTGPSGTSELGFGVPTGPQDLQMPHIWQECAYIQNEPARGTLSFIYIL